MVGVNPFLVSIVLANLFASRKVSVDNRWVLNELKPEPCQQAIITILRRWFVKFSRGLTRALAPCSFILRLAWLASEKLATFFQPRVHRAEAPKPSTMPRNQPPASAPSSWQGHRRHIAAEKSSWKLGLPISGTFWQSKRGPSLHEESLSFEQARRSPSRTTIAPAWALHGHAQIDRPFPVALESRGQ